MASEPVDDNGRPYHIRLDKRSVGRIALLPGDPGRVSRIAERMSRAKELSTNREFTAWGGYVGKERVVAMSTGIGGPATAIAVEELARLGVRVMVRVGTCGAIQRHVRVGSLVIADSAVRMEGTSHQYVHGGYPAAATPEVVMALKSTARRLGNKASVGIAASTDSFYVGQGRKAFGGYSPLGSEAVTDELRKAQVLCFEMEAATLFTLGRIFGLKTGAVLAVVGNRATNDFRSGAGVEDAIEVAVEGVKSFKKFGV